jgi:hypothetical protein
MSSSSTSARWTEAYSGPVGSNRRCLRLPGARLSWGKRRGGLGNFKEELTVGRGAPESERRVPAAQAQRRTTRPQAETAHRWPSDDGEGRRTLGSTLHRCWWRRLPPVGLHAAKSTMAAAAHRPVPQCRVVAARRRGRRCEAAGRAARGARGGCPI